MRMIAIIAVLLLAFSPTPDDNDDCNTQADLYYAGCMAVGGNVVDCSKNQYCVWHKCMKDRGHTLVPVEYCNDN